MKRWLPIALGTGASLLAAALLPTTTSAGVRGMLLLSPLAGALFATLARQIEARPASAVERLLWAAWAAAALHAERLGWPFVDRLLAAGLVLIVAGRILALGPALRRWLGRAGGGAAGRLFLPFAWAPLAAGLALLPWVHSAAEPNGDEPYFLLLAESLASDGDFDLADEYRDEVSKRFGSVALGPQPGDRTTSGGELHSRHESILVVYLTPFWVVGGAAAVRVAMLLVWAALAERLVALARAAGVAERGAVRAWALALFAPPLIVYASQIWAEMAAALCVAVALERWLRGRRAGADAQAAELVVVAAALSLLPLLKLRLLLVAAPLALVWFFDRGRRRRWAPLVVVVVAASAALIAVRNQWIAGQPLGVYDAEALRVTQGVWAQMAQAASGMMFDLGFGLGASGPIWLVALAGASVLVWRQGVWRWITLAFLPYFAAVVSLRSWYGGWCPPFRYGIVTLPILFVALAMALESRASRRAQIGVAGLALASLLLAVAVVIEPGWATNFADGGSRLLDLATAPFPADFGRLFPSALRPRTATWLAPTAVVLLVAACVRGRRRLRFAVAPLGAALLLALGAATIAAAHLLPTRVAEAEDRWIHKEGGALFPERWTVDRTRFTGGFSLPRGKRLFVRPVSGSERVRIRVRLRPDPANTLKTALWFLVEDVVVHRKLVAAAAGWQTVELEPLPWSPGRILTLRTMGGREPAPPQAVIIDRVEFDWL